MMYLVSNTSIRSFQCFYLFYLKSILFVYLIEVFIINYLSSKENIFTLFANTSFTKGVCKMHKKENIKNENAKITSTQNKINLDYDYNSEYGDGDIPDIDKPSNSSDDERRDGPGGN